MKIESGQQDRKAMRRPTDDGWMVCGGRAKIDASMNRLPSFSLFELHGTSWRSFQFSEVSAAKSALVNNIVAYSNSSFL